MAEHWVEFARAVLFGGSIGAGSALFGMWWMGIAWNNCLAEMVWTL